MKHINELQQSLKHYFNLSFWNTECLTYFIIALQIINDVNLSQIAKCFPSKASTTSCYRRLQRFITRFEISFLSLWKLVDTIFNLSDQVILCMDRTNWKFGKVHINFLMIAIAYKGVAIPVIWSLLPQRKRGNSKAIDRQRLFDQLLEFIPATRIKTLLCDREFIDGNWIAYLSSKQVKFVIRAKGNYLASNKKISKLFLTLKASQARTLHNTKCIVGCDLYVSGLRLPTGELVIVVTREFNLNALDQYKIRWEIESFFSAIKKRGFNFENTHLTDMQKLSRLMFVVSIALIWSYRTGEILESIKPIKIKKHGFKAKSLIKIGTETIAKSLARAINSSEYICNIIKATFKPKISISQRMALVGVM